tara:strand:+ start:127 stop:474 length:348 start_codon:yes stop_codon:yes gene_type:complete
MIEAYKQFWTKSFDYKGKANRSDYWLGGVLANFIVYILLFILSGITASINETLGGIISIIWILYSLGQIIPGLSISIRRLRDAGKEWAWIFINFVPFVGGVWFIVLLCAPTLPSA